MVSRGDGWLNHKPVSESVFIPSALESPCIHKPNRCLGNNHVQRKCDHNGLDATFIPRSRPWFLSCSLPLCRMSSPKNKGKTKTPKSKLMVDTSLRVGSPVWYFYPWLDDWDIFLWWLRKAPSGWKIGMLSSHKMMICLNKKMMFQRKGFGGLPLNFQTKCLFAADDDNWIEKLCCLVASAKCNIELDCFGFMFLPETGMRMMIQWCMNSEKTGTWRGELTDEEYQFSLNEILERLKLSFIQPWAL